MEASGMMDFFTLLPEVWDGGIFLAEIESLRILYANPSFQKTFLAKQKESPSSLSSLNGVVHPEDAHLWKTELLQLPVGFMEPKTVQIRFEFPSSSHLQWFHFLIKPVRLSQISERPLIIGFVHETTIEKVTEENVQEQMRLFLGLFENSSIGMALQDWEGGYFRINKKFAEITGYSILDLTELNLKRVKGEVLKEEELEYFNVHQNELEIGEATLTRKDGRKINIYRRINTFRNVQGKPDFYYVILDDLTEKKQMESYQLHSQKMETIGNLAANLAHDLNNYLQPIHVFSQLGKETLLIKEEIAEEESRLLSYLNKIHLAASSARSMIHKIIRFSKINESEVITIVDLSAIIQSSIPILVADAPKNVDLQFQLAEENVLWVKVDPVRITKILGEIVSGSLCVWKKDGEGVAQIKTSLRGLEAEELQPNVVLIQISLFGVDANTIGTDIDFSKSFFEEDETQWSGLSLINRYVRNWFGELHFKKKSNEELEIEILLPLVASIHPEHLGTSNGNISKSEDNWEFLSKKEFWIVEDDEPSLDSLAMVFSLKNIKPKLFTSAFAALQASRESLPDFVLSDYRMKEMNGLVLLRKLKQINPNLVAVLYTGNAEGLADESLEEERILVRTKPISIEELYESILLSFDLL
ncbi:PAS domain S-box protein [Leptospira ryugenii]|uniref:histidine kinase n=1 Tax=Leptospira ryugenii TaxID=1917863 RepID=A0A2P2E0R8_9LEPT|nr:PAS domain S-box protein [Leptospira ryugenii]GBF50481.1 PAS domain S-box protein [Leptospira ryugenii]